MATRQQLAGLAAAALIVAMFVGSILFSHLTPGGGATVTVTVTRWATRTVTVTVTAGAGGVAKATATVASVPQPKPPSRPVMLQGSGATFPYPQLEVWMSMFMKQYPTIHIEYAPKGSGAGQADFFNHVVDFAGSDPPLTHEKWLEYKGKVMQIPYLGGAIVVVYNVPEAAGVHLNLTADVVAKIYLGLIKYWDDPEIQELNPAVKLPHKLIIAVHRSDASGTTEYFTLWLTKASRTWREWFKEHGLPSYGKSIVWPVDSTGRGIGAKGNPGVAQAVLSRPYTIGYVEWGYALEKHMTYAALENSAGRFVLPTVESIKAALAGMAKRMAEEMGGKLSPLGDWSKDMYYVINAPGANSYPLTAVTHLLVWRCYSDPAKVEALKLWLWWIAEVGEKHVIPGYAPAPASLRNVALEAAQLLTTCS